MNFWKLILSLSIMHISVSTCIEIEMINSNKYGPKTPSWIGKLSIRNATAFIVTYKYCVNMYIS